MLIVQRVVCCWHFLAVLESEHVRQLSEDYLPFVDGRQPVDRDPMQKSRHCLGAFWR